MRRLVALVAAVVMVGGAVYVRSRLDRNEVARTVRLVCATEVATACSVLSSRLQATVEPAGTTADRLATAEGDAGLDGWLVPDPWPDLVDERRRKLGLPALFGDQQRIARSPLVMVVAAERAARLSGRCGGDVNWKCLGEAIQRGTWSANGGDVAWGPIKPGHASPATDAVGLLVLGHAVAGFFSRSGLSSNDLDDDAFAGWFTALERAVPAAVLSDSPLQRMAAGGAAFYDAVGTTEAEAGPLLEQASRRNELRLLYPSPMASADVILASGRRGSAASSVRELAAGTDAKRALGEAGWRVPGQPNARGVPNQPALAPESGLPPAGLLDALRSRWQEVTGR